MSDEPSADEHGKITHAYFMRIRAGDKEAAERDGLRLTQRLVAVEANMADIVKDMATFNRWSITILGGLTLAIASYLGTLIVNNSTLAANNRVVIAETAVVVKDLGTLVKEITATANKRFDGVDADVEKAYDKLDGAIIRHRAAHDADHRNGFHPKP